MKFKNIWKNLICDYFLSYKFYKIEIQFKYFC